MFKGGGGVFTQPVYMCFVDREKAYDHVPQGVLWGVLREWGFSGSMGLMACCHRQACLFTLGVGT